MSKKHSVETSDNTYDALQQTQRLLAWSAYQESLKEVDRQVLSQFQAAIANLRASVWIKAGIYLAQFSTVSVGLFWTIHIATDSNRGQPWIWAIPFACLALIGVLLFRNPIESINRTLVDLTRVQIILQGYNRQVNQLDAIFKQALLDNTIDMESIEVSLNHIQKMIDGNIESLLQFLDELHL